MIITAIVCVCLTGIAMFEDDGMLRSVAVLGSVAALYRAASVVLVVGSVLGVYVLFTHWFGLVVPFVCLFVFQHTRWCMSSNVHYLTPDLTIFQLMWTVAPWSHFFR